MKKLILSLALLSASLTLQATPTPGTPSSLTEYHGYDQIGTQLNSDYSAYLSWFVHTDPLVDMVTLADGQNGGAPLNAYLDSVFVVYRDPITNVATLKITGMAPRSFTNNASHTIQTVAASANGFQLSTTRDSAVSYSVTISSATQIGVTSNVSGYVVLEVCAINSSTAANWQEISRVTNGNQIGLAIALALTATGGGPVTGIVPAGFYTRLRSVTTNGTPTFTYNSGQEVLE